MRDNHSTIFIAGAGHTGSTLLGLVLGSRDDAFYAGEAAKSRFLGDARKPERKRVCKLCGPACPVWGDFRAAAEPDLYEQLSRRTGRGWVIDSSKDPTWLAEQTRAVSQAGGRAIVIFMQRDGRAVLNSRLRKYPDRDPAEVIERWQERMRVTRSFFDAFDGPKMEVRYEEFATESKRIVRAVCGAIDMDFQESMLRFDEHVHHVLGGNNGTQWQIDGAEGWVQLSDRARPYYEDHPKGIVLDLRWPSELDPAALSLFDRVASTDNVPFAWRLS